MQRFNMRKANMQPAQAAARSVRASVRLGREHRAAAISAFNTGACLESSFESFELCSYLEVAVRLVHGVRHNAG